MYLWSGSSEKKITAPKCQHSAKKRRGRAKQGSVPV
jgi:hypothetical protein